MKSISIKKNKKNKGFTLVELLAVIAILAIILTIVIYSVINIMNNSKESSYTVTVNNVENQASSYVLENLSLSKWQYGSISDTSYQYQCVSIQNLIDAGYFKSDILESYVSKDRLVLSTDNIYVERDTANKSITKNVLILDDKYSGLCDDFNITGNISFKISPSGWAKTKEVTVKYYIYNVNNVSNYKYNYSFGDETVSDNFDRSSHEEVITVTENGIMEAKILDKEGNAIVSDDLLVGNIDNEGPRIIFGMNGNSSWSKNASSKISVTDDGSGVDTSSLKYVFSTDKNADSENVFTNNGSVSITDKDGEYYLIAYACDKVGNCTRTVSNAFKLDNTVPNISFTVNGNSSWSKTASSKISVTDASGVDTSSLKYIFSTSTTSIPTTLFTNNGSVSKSNETGEYYLIAYACDLAGNCTTKVSNVFKLDNTGPRIVFGTNGNSSWSKTASSKISVTDNNVSIDTSTLKYIFSTSSTATSITTFTNEEIVSQSSGNGNYYLVAKACDMLGNCTTTSSNVFKLDNTAPTLEITHKTADGATYNGGWTNQVITSVLTYSDSDSGIDTSKVISWTNVNTMPVTLTGCSESSCTDTWGTNAGDRSITGYNKVCDKLGNCTTKSYAIKQDMTPPVITCDNTIIYTKQWRKEYGNVIDNVPKEQIDELTVQPSTSDMCVASVTIKRYVGNVLINGYDAFDYYDALSGIKDRTYTSDIYRGDGTVSNEGFLPVEQFSGSRPGKKVFTLELIDYAGNKATGTFTIDVTY